MLDSANLLSYSWCMDFSAGDLVICVDDTNLPPNWTQHWRVQAGLTYRIDRLEACGCGIVGVELVEDPREKRMQCYFCSTELNRRWKPERFRKLAPEQRIVEDERQFELATPVGWRSRFGVS